MGDQLVLEARICQRLPQRDIADSARPGPPPPAMLGSKPCDLSSIVDQEFRWMSMDSQNCRVKLYTGFFPACH